MITVKGKLEFIDIGTGQWDFTADNIVYRAVPAHYDINTALATHYTALGGIVTVRCEESDLHTAGGTIKPILIIHEVNPEKN